MLVYYVMIVINVHVTHVARIRYRHRQCESPSSLRPRRSSTTSPPTTTRRSTVPCCDDVTINRHRSTSMPSSLTSPPTTSLRRHAHPPSRCRHPRRRRHHLFTHCHRTSCSMIHVTHVIDHPRRHHDPPSMTTMATNFTIILLSTSPMLRPSYLFNVIFIHPLIIIAATHVTTPPQVPRRVEHDPENNFYFVHLFGRKVAVDSTGNANVTW